MSGHGGSKRFRRLQTLLNRTAFLLDRCAVGITAYLTSRARIYTMSGSPKNVYQAIDNTLKDLKKFGHVPREVRLK